MSFLGDMVAWLERDKGIVFEPSYRRKLLSLEANVRDEALPIAFAACETLVSAGLLALAEKEDKLAGDAYIRRESARGAGGMLQAQSDIARHEARAACLREMSLAVSLGQFRTAECNERAVVAAHREAAGFHSGSRGGHARAAKLSPERRKEIAQLAARARWAAKKGE